MGAEAELKTFVAAESGKLNARMVKFDGQIAKCQATITKFLAEVAKKDKEELEGFRLAAIKKFRSFQTKNKLKTEDVFKKVAKGGKVDESDFVKFVQKQCKKETNGDAEEEEEVELSGD